MARRVTLKDIAERLDVSTAVVSTVLSNRDNGIHVSQGTRQRVLETAAELGYTPVSRRPTRRTTRKAVCNVAVLCFPWYSGLMGATVAELCRTLNGWDFHPSLYVDEDEVRACERVRELNAQGIADAAVMLGTRNVPEAVAVGNIPCVVIGEVPEDTSVWSVCAHNPHGGQLVGEYLWRLGHRRVGVVLMANRLYSAKRLDGLRSVWERNGRSLPEEWVFPLRDQQDLREALPSFLQQIEEREGAPLTALFCAGDVLAAVTVKTLTERGWRIPEDISVVGFDDAPLLAECLHPPLTTVRMPFVQLGHLAAQLLRERMEQPTAPPRRLFLPGELVVRRSAAPVPEAAF